MQSKGPNELGGVLQDILVRLLRRFMKRQAVEKRYGSDLTSIECQDVKLQLPDKSIVIGKGAREALVKRINTNSITAAKMML